MLFSKYLLCILLLLVQTFTSANSEGFTCTTAKTCKSLAGYLVPRPTTLSHIGTLFGFELSDFSYLLGANNLPIDTPPTTSVVADKIIVIPFTCACKNGTGIADQTTRYTVQVGDFLDRIGRDIFSMLVTYEEIAAVNNFSNSNLIEVDQVLWIPLPCSCDDMEGNQVAHYAHVVRRINGDGDVESLEMIAKQFGVTVESLLKLNDGNKKPNAETVLDIPLRACANKVRNTSVDYPLLVANGTYTFTANNCVKCTCDSDNNNSTLLCEPSSPKDKFEYSSPCPSAQCIGHGAKATKLNSSLGKHSYLDDSGCYKRYCAYTGFDNSPIISASLVNKTTCPDARLSPPPFSSSPPKRKAIIWKIIIPLITLVATIMGISGYIYLFKRNKEDSRGRLKELQGVLTDLLKSKATYNDNPNTNMLNDGKSEEETQELQIFNLACLAIATNDFILENKLGEGGFGPVYKGKLQNGQEIAVKRLSKSSGQGIEEFKNEVLLISKLQHRNLVKLLGCCVEGDENMLVYEFMPNKSLDTFLFDPRRKVQLDWEKRFNIIGGIARGLLYLHRDSRLRVIHRDLKVSNILLAHDMTPKISDFGMARIFCANQIIANTSRVVGTFGYMSPEYIMGGTFSEKSDVFSFGVLTLEIVSSKKNNSFYDPEQPLNLLLHTWRLWSEGRWEEVVDEALGNFYSLSEVMKCIHIGLLCVQNKAVDRPTMAEVDFMLISETDLPSPKEPPYSFPTLSDKSGFPEIVCSNNNVTFTAVEGR